MAGHVTVDQLSKSYGDLKVLDGASLEVGPGEFVSIVGPSGCGKSTLLEIVGGLRTYDAGGVEIDGEPVSGPRPDTGIIFQEGSTLPWRTLLDNVVLPLELRGMRKRDAYEAVRDVIRMVGLEGFESHRPAQLSGGMRQRVALARVLATEPALILADEPFGALDEQTRLMVALDLLRVVSQTSASVLFITHSIQEAVLLSDRVLVMSARPGRIIAEAVTDLGQPRTADLIGTERVDKCAEVVWTALKAESQKAMTQQGER